MKHIYNLKFVFSFVAVLFISSGLFSQQVAVTEDGREIYLQSDLEKMPVEKQNAISKSDNAIVIDSKEELGSYKLIQEKEKLAEQNKKAQSNLKESKRELKEKEENGELSDESKAKEIFNENLKKEKLEEKVRSGSYTEDEIAEMEKKHSGSPSDESINKVEMDKQEELKEREIILEKKRTLLDKRIKSGEISKSEAKDAYKQFEKSLNEVNADESSNSK